MTARTVSWRDSVLLAVLGASMAAVGCGRSEAAAPAPAGSATSPSPAMTTSGATATTVSTTTGATTAPTGGPRASASGAASRASDGLCRQTCVRSEPLHCTQASQCEAQCAQMRALPACGDELDAALRCFASVPSPGWECDDQGQPSVKEGHCDAEQARFADCLKKATPNLPQ